MKALLKDSLGHGLIFAPAYTAASVITGGLRFGGGVSPIPLQLLKFLKTHKIILVEKEK